MKIEKEDLIKLMQDTIKDNWLNPSMTSIDNYERAITLISGGIGGEIQEYDGRTDDIEKLILHIHEYSDFTILNVYDIIYKHRNHPWKFMEKMKG